MPTCLSKPQKIKSPPESPSIYICILFITVVALVLLVLPLLLLYICISPLMYRTKSLQIIITYIRVRTCANAYIGTRIYIHTYIYIYIHITWNISVGAHARVEWRFREWNKTECRGTRYYRSAEKTCQTIATELFNAGNVTIVRSRAIIRWIVFRFRFRARTIWHSGISSRRFKDTHTYGVFYFVSNVSL